MSYWLLSPVVVFIIVFAAAVLLSGASSKLAFKGKVAAEGMKKPYACGEDVSRTKVHPDYSQFFPFAFFFTILHVITLIITTVPLGTVQNLFIAMSYILGAVVGLTILFRG